MYQAKLYKLYQDDKTIKKGASKSQNQTVVI